MIPTGDPASTTYASVEVTLREPSTSWPEVQARARPPGYEGPFGWPLPDAAIIRPTIWERLEET